MTTGLSRRRLLSVSALAAVGAALTACGDGPAEGRGDGGSGEASPTTSAAPGSPATGAPPVGWQSLDAHMLGQHATVEVGPLVTMDERSTILPVRLTRLESQTDSSGSSGDWNPYVLWAGPESMAKDFTAVRLLDTEGLRVWTGVTGYRDGDGSGLKPGQTVTVYGVFGPVDLPQVTAFLPLVGFPVVAVVSKDEAVSALGSDVDLDTALAEVELDSFDDDLGDEQSTLAVASEPALLETYTRTPDESSASRVTDKEVVTTLASDVTFASGSSELTSEADAQLQVVAGQVSSYPEGGALEVVGHTDDVADEAFNQTLSEQRATAVKDRLGELVDLSAWTVTASGRGEGEPAVADTTEEARAANRRVVITLTPSQGTGGGSLSPAPSASAQLPEPEGPSATGSEGVRVSQAYDRGEVTISVDRVERRGGLLLGTLTVSGSTGGSNLLEWLHDPTGDWQTNNRDEEGDFFTDAGANGVTLLADGLVYSPSDYIRGGWDYHRPLADLHLEPLEGRTTVCVVWPDTGQDTVVIDHLADPELKDSDYPWRLTDVPVV